MHLDGHGDIRTSVLNDSLGPYAYSQAVSECKSICLLWGGTLNLREEALKCDRGQETEALASAQPAKCLKLRAGQTLVWVLALRELPALLHKPDP